MPSGTPRARDAGARTVACVDAATYIDELIAALQGGTLERWRARYRAVDLLIVDDVEAFESSEGSQDEFFHLFNALQQAGKQIVLTSHLSPGQLPGLQPRLRSRFAGGLITEMGIVQGVDRWGRNTPVPNGDEAAAPTIDAIIDQVLSSADAEHAVDAGGERRTRVVLDAFFFDGEKVVAEWVGIDGRVLEELR